MQIYLSVDDTDNLTSIGSGQLAENLTEELINCGLVKNCSNITRHQLYYHDDIPYTSHNSSMCFTASISPASLTDLVAFSSLYLKDHSAQGSDPGLCIAEDSDTLDREALIQFGQQAKSTILNKDLAYNLANSTKVHLSEHGGTGDGVIGALAGIGLRLQGNDGRFRGWFNMGEIGEITTAAQLCKHHAVSDVIDENGQSLAPESPIRITDEKIKTILHNHIQVIPVARLAVPNGTSWATLSRKEVKKF
ncbi:MAG: hypothetical protein ACI8ZB_000839 [Desulforhopalus sp.]|jgi:hypothetical protein